MSVKTRNVILASGLLQLWAAPSFAQVVLTPPQPLDTNLLGVVNAPQFFISIVAGLVLAFGFQSVLTALSVAVGLSSTPDLKKLSAKHYARSSARKDGLIEDEGEDEEKALKEDGSLAVKATSTFGFWAMITTSIALFFATWLAVRLSFVNVTEIGLVLGLVIWAAFFMTMTYLELKTVRSAMGGIINLAFSGVRGTFDTVRGVFSPSLEKQMEEGTRRSVNAIYEEISHIAHKDHLDKKVHDYLMALKPEMPDYDKVRDDIKEMINDIEVEEKFIVDEEDVARVLNLHLEKHHAVMNKHNASKLMQTAREAVREARKHRRPADKAIAAAGALTPLSPQEVQKWVDKIETYLDRADTEGLDAEKLRNDIDQMFADPLATGDIIRHRLSRIDEDTVRQLIANNSKISDDKADKYAHMLMSAIEFVRNKQHQDTGMEATGADEGQGLKDKAKKLPYKIDQKIAAYFESLDEPELDYEGLKMDVSEILHDPTSAPRVLKTRLAQMDRGTLVAILSSNAHISQRQAEKIADKIIEARDSVSETVHKIEDEALARYRNLSRRTVIAAEHARESAVAASWWTVGTAMISGICAAVGGFLGTTI